MRQGNEIPAGKRTFRVAASLFFRNAIPACHAIPACRGGERTMRSIVYPCTRIKEASMAAIRYMKANWVAQADIQALANGKFQGVVLISQENAAPGKEAQHTVATAADSPAEALEEAKALAHRLLAGIDD
jgi:hypothetical protein